LHGVVTVIRSVLNAIDYLHHRGIAIVGFGMQVHFPPLTFLCSKRETFPFSGRTTHSISGSFGYVVPEDIRNTGSGVLAHQYDCSPTHTQMKHKLTTLSAQPSSHTLSSAAIPLFVPTPPLPLPSKTPTPKL